MSRTSHFICTAIFCLSNLFFINKASAQDQQEQNSSAQISQELGEQEANVMPSTTEAPLDTSKLSYSNKWRVKFDNRSDSDGEITFLVVLKDATPVTIVVPVKKGTSENSIAKLVRDTLKASVPKGVKVERDDGEDVLVKYKDRFSLSLQSNTVKDLDINLDKE